MEQIVLGELDAMSQKQGLESLYYCWTLEGYPVKSFMNIHRDCRILIASSTQNFKGLVGLHRFQDVTRHHIDTSEIKPKPATWV